MGFKVAVQSCTHLGYAQRNCAMNRATSWNQRVVDGHIAHDLTMRDIIDQGVDLYVHAGDLFHWQHPRPRDIAAAIAVDDARVEADIPALYVSGNHDAAAGSDSSAISVMHRPALNAHAVFPAPHASEARIGPYPGRYEVHQPLGEDAPLLVHAISHYGLEHAHLREQGITIDPQPLDGYLNILTSHGIFIADERLYRASERHGEERTVPTDWCTRGFDAYLLGDYHSLGEVTGFGDDRGRGQVWYAGSALRRGFSDDPGPRGWLLLELHDDGTVQITPRHIWQRPQTDFEPIDATSLTVAHINTTISDRLSAQRWHDPLSEQLTGHGGHVLRQKITGTTAAQRAVIKSMSADWSRLTANAAYWAVECERAAPGAGENTPTAGRAQRDIASRITDFTAALNQRSETGKVAAVLDRLDAEARAAVIADTRQLLSDTDQTPAHPVGV